MTITEPELEVYAGYDPLTILGNLDTALEWRQLDLARYSDYYEGAQQLVYTTEKWRRAFGGLFTQFSDNWCALVVDAVEERLNVEGFRFGDQAGDTDAWEMWQRNGLDADSTIAHIDALIYGVSYALVWADADATPIISVESPRQTIVAYAPDDRRRRVAGLKRFSGGDGTTYATLYMPDYVWKFQARSASPGLQVGPMVGGWAARETAGEPWPLPNPLGVVPIVPLVNRPRLLPRRHGATEGASEIHQVIPVQDAINKILLDMIVASEFGAFRQRWVTGMEIPTDPVTGQPVEPFRSAVDRLWMAENAEVKFGEFGQTDLSPYVKSVEMLVQHIASQTRTPPHYFYLSGQFPSGESIKAAETGLVAKARRKMRPFGEGWEEVIRLGFAFRGDPRSSYWAAETIWGDPESRTEGEHVDALLKLKALEIPLQALWERANFSPQEIARFPAMRAEEAFITAAMGMPAPPPVTWPPVPGTPPSRAA